MWEHRWPPPLHTSQQWHLVFQADPASSRGIPSHASPHSRPFYCIRAANCVSLPGSLLPTPCFGLPTLPALADSHPRQGHPALIPKEVLRRAALRPLEPTQVEETPAQGEGGLAWVGAPPNARRGQRSWWMGKGVIIVAPPLARCSTMMLSYGVSGFFHSLWHPLLLSLQAVFSQPRAVLSLGLHSKPLFPTPSSPSQQATHDSGWNVHSCSVDHACGSYLVLPSTDRLLHSPLIP